MKTYSEFITEKVYEDEHHFRIENPNKYSKFNRKNDEFKPGIDVVYGITSDGKAEVQALIFKTNKFSFGAAKKWVEEHDFKIMKSQEAGTER